MTLRDYRTRIYERYASHFRDAKTVFDESEANRWGRAYDYYLRGWLPERKDAAIVDIACGSGKLLHFFKKRGYSNLLGVDISPGQVQLARCVTNGVTQGDGIDFLERRTSEFDLITGLDIIEHFDKDEVLRFLDACYNALKPGGRLILQTPNADSPWVSSVRYGDFSHEVCLNPYGIARILALCGFNNIKAREQGPVLHGILSGGRLVCWLCIRAALKVSNLVETGTGGSGIFTRVFIVKGEKD
jgi:2-polyprenyl-3-methyl-5-hydroxy-6-metoxy-1,4-benzoquinol methylase